MKKAIDAVAGRVIFSFEGLADIRFDPTRAHTANQAYASLFGWMSRLGDAAAIPREQKLADGTTRTIAITEAMRREAIQKLVDHYYSGSADWNIRGNTVRSLNPLYLKLAEKRGCTYEEIEAEKIAEMEAELAAFD